MLPSPSYRRSLLPSSCSSASRPMGKRLLHGILMRILLALVHLLAKLLRLLLVRETKSKQTVLPLESVEESAVLIIREGIVDLLVPEHPAAGVAHVDELHPEGVADGVVGQHGGALQTRVRPSRAVRVGDVEFGDGDGLDLVACFGDGALDDELLVFAEDRGHGRGSILGGGGSVPLYLIGAWVE